MFKKEQKPDWRSTCIAAQNLNETMTKQISELVEKNSKLRTDLETSKRKIREQNAADLLLNALEAVGIIKKDPPKSLVDYQSIHKQRMAGLQDQGHNYNVGAVSQFFGL